MSPSVFLLQTMLGQTAPPTILALLLPAAVTIRISLHIAGLLLCTEGSE